MYKRQLVGSEASGRVIEVRVDYNSIVNEGDVLAIIDSSNLESRVSQLENQVISANVDRDVQLVSIERSKTILKNAEVRLKRELGLYEKKATSLAALESVEREHDIALADVKLAETTLKARNARIEQIKAELSQVKIDLDQTIIRSPIEGIVIDKKVEIGQTVQASFNSPELFVIANDLSEFYVEAKIPESDIANVNPNDRAVFSIDALPGRFMSGIVKSIRFQPNLDTTPVTYTSIIRVHNPYNDIRPGMSVSLQIIAEEKQNVVVLPKSAIRFRPSPNVISKHAIIEDDYNYVESVLSDIRNTLMSIKINGKKTSNILQDITNRSKKDIAVIDDPRRIAEHQSAKIKIREAIDQVLRQALDDNELIEFLSSYSKFERTHYADVWLLLDDNKIKRNLTRLGLDDGEFVEVISGVSDKDKVVTATLDTQ